MGKSRLKSSKCTPAAATSASHNKQIGSSVASKSRAENKASVQKSRYTTEDAVNMVVYNGLTPSEALRATLHPCSMQTLNDQVEALKKSKTEIAPATAVVAAAAPVPPANITVSTRKSKTENPISLLEEVQQQQHQNEENDEDDNSSRSSLSVSSLKTWWEEETYKLSRLTPEQQLQVMEDQTFRNSTAADRYSAAFKEATKRWESSRKKERIYGWKRETLRSICDDVNRDFILGGNNGRAVIASTVGRYVCNGRVGTSPMRRGRRGDKLPVASTPDKARSKAPRKLAS